MGWKISWSSNRCFLSYSLFSGSEKNKIKACYLWNCKVWGLFRSSHYVNINSFLMFNMCWLSPWQVRERLQKMGPFQPMNIFLRQEIDRMQRVLTLVRSVLTELKLAIDGTIIMSENLRDALNCMFDARIPAQWQKVCLSLLLPCLIALLSWTAVTGKQKASKGSLLKSVLLLRD